MTKTNSTGAFAMLVSVFFFWGFVAASNDILIPAFKKALTLTQLQSQMISFAFYIAYTVGSLLYYGASEIKGKDILSAIGYRNGLALGLAISAAGTLLFIPAANNASFILLLAGLFTVGIGFSLQQTAANPLAIVMGDPAKSSQRLSLAGGINNIGTTIGPVVIAYAIFGSPSAANSTLNLESVKIPYLILGAAFLIVALLFKLSSVPDQIPTVESSHTEDDNKRFPFDYPQLYLGMIAIFVYVGVEVSTASNLPEFLKQKVGIMEESVAPYVSLFWASLMIGRWTSAADAFNLSKTGKQILNILLPFAAFGVFLIANTKGGHDVSNFYFYGAFILLIIAADRISDGRPAKQLMLYSFLGILSLLVGIYGTGMISAYAFICVGLFCSTLWPCIFTLAITGLGRHTNEGSSLLIMMIMGGGIVSLIQGYFADHVVGIQNSYWVGVVCFAYLAYYAYRTRNLNVSNTEVKGH